MSAPALLHRLDIDSAVLFRALQLGDMLCAVPALRALRAALPGTRITLVGLPWAEQFVQRFSLYLDDFIAFPGHAAFPEQAVQQRQLLDFYHAMQARGDCLAVQMHGSGEFSNGIVKSFRARTTAGYAPVSSSDCDRQCFFPYPANGPEPLRLLHLVELLGATPMGTHLEFPLTDDDWDELNASGMNASLVPGNYVCIHPGARLRDKCWPAALFAKVADHIAETYGLAIVLTGSVKEHALTSTVAQHMRMPAVNAAAPISIGAMAALMSGARLLVCNDTGVSHIAAGLKLRSVIIFSKADVLRWAPLDRHLHRTVWDPKGELYQTVHDKVDEQLNDIS